MSERARIIAWWGYVVCVVAIFEVVFQTLGFAYAVGAALLAIPTLGLLLKVIVGQLARRGKRRGSNPTENRAG
jgi:hypothetical protein